MVAEGLEACKYLRSPLLRSPAAAGAPLASHAVKSSDHKQQEAYADGYSHDSHSSLGSLRGHCVETTKRY